MKKSKAELIYEPLRQELLQMPVGSRAGSIRELMRRYETSQLSITRVLSRFVEEGVLNRQPDGTLVVRGETEHEKKRIGLLIPDWPSASFVEIEERLKLRVAEFDMVVQRVNYPLSYSFRELRVTGFDALILIPDRPLTTEDAYYIGNAPVPVVIMGRTYDEMDLNFVSVSPLQNGVLAASYLYGKGHRKFAIVISEPHNSVVAGRHNGFLTFARAAGCSVEEIDCEVISGENSQSKTHAVVSARLKNHRPDYTAIYVLSDSTALGVICALAEHGYKVPDDFSVIGSDGLRQGGFFLPALTTVGADFNLYIDRLIEAINMLWQDSGRICHITMDAFVLERDSVKPISLT